MSTPLPRLPLSPLVAAIDRGLVPDWQPVFAEIRQMPWGPVARRAAAALREALDPGQVLLFGSVAKGAQRPDNCCR